MAKTQKIPTYQSEGRLPAHPLAPTVSPSAMTPDLAAKAQLGVGIAGLGGKLMAFATAQAKEAKDIFDYTQRIDAKNKMNLYYSDLESGLAGRDDPQNWVTEFDAQAPGKESEILAEIRDPDQRAILHAQFGELRVLRRARMQSAATARDSELKVGTFRDAFNDAIRDGDLTNAESGLFEAYNDGRGIIAETEFQSKLSDLAANDAIQQGDAEWLFEKSKPKKGKKAVYANYPDLSIDGRRAAQGQYNFWSKKSKENAKTLKDIYIEQSHKSVITELAKGTSDLSFLNNFTPEVRDFWMAQVQKDLTKYDPALYSGIKQAIREAPDEVDSFDIVQSVGNGLTPERAAELLALQDKMQVKDSPLSQPHVVRAHDRIADLQGMGMPIGGIEPPTEDSSPEEIIQYYNLFDKIHETIDNNISMSPTEMRTFTEEVVTPIVEEGSKGFWSRLWSITPIGMAQKLGGAYLVRERTLRNRPKDRGDFESKFKRLYEIDKKVANRYWDRWNKEL